MTSLKIYTKTGDRGETSLLGGKRVQKDDLRVEAYGTVDELNSIIGVCRTLSDNGETDDLLCQIQNNLFVLGTDLATHRSGKTQPVDQLAPDAVSEIESKIDHLVLHLKPLKNFILPGGSKTAAMLHFARTVCRRAERTAVKLARHETIGEIPVTYLNRLSDLLFVLARWENSVKNITEEKWRGKQNADDSGG